MTVKNLLKPVYIVRIFCTKFNLSFHKPKSDRCPVCEKERVAVKENIQIQESERRYYEKHEKYDSNTFVS
jgi:uncharacterized protein with PIN domain